MKSSRFILVQLSVLGIALGAGNPPPLPSYNFGITGEPTKVDTAFGNLGVLGPAYNIPDASKEPAETSTGNHQLDTTYPTTTRATVPPNVRQPTTAARTENPVNSNVEGISTTTATDAEAITQLGSDVLNSTLNKGESYESNTLPNTGQTFETTSTTFSKEQPTSITTQSENNITSNPFITEESYITGASSSSNTTPPTAPSSTISENSVQTTKKVRPSQNFHTGTPNATEAPAITSPGQNETKPGQNPTIPSKPNSSLALHPGKGDIWPTLTVIYILIMIANIK